MRARTPHTLLTAAVTGTALTLTACVSEVVPVNPANRPAGSLNTDQAKVNGPLNTTPGRAGNLPPASVTGTIATVHVAAAIRPLGSIPYDGLTLPLVTPDGRFIITQTGPAPAMESVLAETGATPQLASAIKVFQVVEAAGGGLNAVDWNAAKAGDTADASKGLTLNEPPSPTLGLLLGRAAGVDSGENGAHGGPWVLVERPNPDSSRWIGKLDLLTGNVEWLVQGSMVNAQALLLRDGTLIYTRRKPDQGSTELVIRPAGAAQAAGVNDSSSGSSPTPPLTERVARRDGWKFCQPIATPDQSMVAVLAVSPDDAQLLAFSTTEKDAAGAPLLLARESMGALGAAGAFQSVTSIEACPPAVDSPLKSAFLFINADRRRLALWQPVLGAENAATSGTVPANPAPAVPAAPGGAQAGGNAGGRGAMTLLPAGASSAARTHSPVASGLVLANSRGMDFLTVSGASARLFTGAYIPRSSTGPTGTRLICFSPHAGSASPNLDVAAVELVAPKQ